MSKRKASPTVPVSFRCPRDLLRAMKRLAKRDGNTLSDLIVPLLRATYAPAVIEPPNPLRPDDPYTIRDMP